MTSGALRLSVSSLSISLVGVLLLAITTPYQQCRADEIEMVNGDHYTAKVLSLDTNTLVIQSEVIGTVRLPRSKVLRVSLGASARANSTRVTTRSNPSPAPVTPAVTNQSPELSALTRQLGANSNLLQKVQSQFLSGAGPEANAKFNELLSGFLNGKLTVNDIRAQAQSAATQLRAAKQELGDDAGWAIDGYLAILDHFLKETASVAHGPVSTTTTPKAAPLSAEQE